MGKLFVMIIAGAVLIFFLVLFAPINNMFNAITPNLVTNVTSNITTYTANGTVIQGFGSLQNVLATNMWLILVLLFLGWVVYQLVTGMKGSQEAE